MGEKQNLWVVVGEPQRLPCKQIPSDVPMAWVLFL